MTEVVESTFWDSIPSNIRIAIGQTIPTTTLQEKPPNPTEPEPLQSKYAQLEHLLEETINQEHQSMQPSTLFPLAMLQTETKKYPLAEETYRQILTANPSDLAATSNLISVSNLQHKYDEAQRLGMKILPLLQNQFGANSPQCLGCMRKLMESLVGQGKAEEARQLWKRGVEFVDTIGDEEVRKEESDAMLEMESRLIRWARMVKLTCTDDKDLSGKS